MQILSNWGLAALTLVAACAAAPAHAQALALAQAKAQTQDPNLGRNLAATCANCHGTNGQARGEMRSLAGEPAIKITSLMAGYKSGALPATIMHQIAKGYTDEQIKLVAEFLAAQKPRP
jgi:cytochrome subunit of sulfide dehydrogenase